MFAAAWGAGCQGAAGSPVDPGQATAEPEVAIGWLQSVVLGIVEGVTEFLPISSTGHLILTNAAFGISDPVFEVAIQAGAITAILVLYWRRLWHAVGTLMVRGGGTDARRPDGTPRVNLLWLILVCAIPATIAGLLLENLIDAYLFDVVVVAVALVVGGVGLLVVERWMVNRQAAGRPVDRELADMTLRQAFLVGLWQCLALIPGTSRSASTIIGGLVTGFSRTAAAEMSFLVGLPILYGACVLKVAGDLERMMGPMLPDLLIASAVSFVTALLVVGTFVRFLQKHTFRVFAHYRIVFGGLVLALWAAGYVTTPEGR